MVRANARAGGSLMPMFGWISGPLGNTYHRVEQPSFRTLNAGDVLAIEIEGRWGGYVAQLDQTFSIGPAHDAVAAARQVRDGCVSWFHPAVLNAVARAAVAAIVLVGCGDDDRGASDGGGDRDGGDSRDAPAADDAPASLDAPPAGDDAPLDLDAGGGDSSLTALRDRLFATFTDTPCATWASLDESQRAVFLTITHRLLLAHLPDGSPALAHLTRLHLVLGGGSSGGSCGGAENNRLFLSMDDALWQGMVDTWGGASVLDEPYVHTRDAAGPHDPFDASIESDAGLRCTFLIETGDSRPPTAQAHFFLDGSAVPVERGTGISLPADPRMLEIDQDFNCIHDSNPTCRDFDEKYRVGYGDFECEWVPSACAPSGTGCYRSAG
jgi:hypothetical protein